MAQGGDQDSDNTNTDNTSAEVWEVLRTLVLGHADHNRLLELYYWSQEPGLLEAVRGLLGLPEDAQAVLRSFLLVAQAHSVSAEVDDQGRLILSSHRSPTLVSVNGGTSKWAVE